MSVPTLFRPATRKKVRGRIGLDGPAGSGKTFTALRLAFTLAKNERPRIAVINSESGAVEKYLGLSPDGIPWQFDVCELPDFAPTTYTAAILEAGRLGYEVIVIDSLSHAWNGVGGALEIVSKKGGSSFTAWKDVTPMHNAMIEAILRSPAHVIATLRSKMEYVLEEYEDSNGRKRSAPRKIGMAPVQRNGMEYEFDVFADLDATHTLTVSKTRCPELDGIVVVKPSAVTFQPLARWLNDGSDVDPSYYVATEEDLRRSLAAREAAAREAAGYGGGGGGTSGNGQSAPPQKSFRELAAERTAATAQPKSPDGGQATSSAAATAPVAGQSAKESAPATDAATHGSSSSSPSGAAAEAAPPANKNRSDNISDNGSANSEAKPGLAIATINAIEEIGQRVFRDKWADTKSATLSARGVGRMTGLSQAQADEILAKLKAKEAANEAAANQVAQAESARENVQEILLGDPCTATQLSEVKRLVGELAAYVPDQEQRVVAAVKQMQAARKAEQTGKAKDMTVQEADTVIAKLTQRLSEKQAGDRLAGVDTTATGAKVKN